MNFSGTGSISIDSFWKLLEMDHFVTLAVVAMLFVAPAFGGSMAEMCRSNSENGNEMVNDLCEAQAALESLQTHLQHMAEKMVVGGMEK